MGLFDFLNKSAGTSGSANYPPYTGGGVCDVCNKSLTGVKAYIVPNKTFWASRKYREYYKNTPMGRMIGMTDMHIDLLAMRDNSQGSAVCDECIHMFY